MYIKCDISVRICRYLYPIEQTSREKIFSNRRHVAVADSHCKFYRTYTRVIEMQIFRRWAQLQEESYNKS